MGVLAILLGIVALAVGGVGLFHRFPRIGLTTRGRAGALMAAAMVVIVTAVATFPAETAVEEASLPDAAPRRLADVEGVRRVEMQGEDLHVDVLLPMAWDGRGYVHASGDMIEALGRVIQAAPENGTQARRLAIGFSAPGNDRLGREAEVTLYRLFFSMDDVRAARFENLTVAGALNLAVGMSLAGQGAQAMLEYCTHRDLSQTGADFCGRMAADLPDAPGA
jgi:hypothetical protein